MGWDTALGELAKEAQTCWTNSSACKYQFNLPGIFPQFTPRMNLDLGVNVGLAVGAAVLVGTSCFLLCYSRHQSRFRQAAQTSTQQTPAGGTGAPKPSRDVPGAGDSIASRSKRKPRVAALKAAVALENGLAEEHDSPPTKKRQNRSRKPRSR